MPPSDADQPLDAIPDATPPDCGAALDPGEVRATIPGIAGYVAIDEEGVIYTPINGDGSWDLAAIDPCGELLWQVSGLETGFGGTPPQAHLYRNDEVILSGSVGFARFLRDDGERLADFPISGSVSNLVGIVDEYGPVFRSYEDEILYLSRVSPDGEDRVAILGMPESPEVAFVWPEECSIFGNQINCFDVAFDLDTLEEDWRQTERIIDGTLRNVIFPARVGRDRFATLLFGVSTYELVVRNIADGTRAWRETLVNSDRGQVGLFYGAPVVAQSRRIITYLHAGGSGFLRAHEPDGPQVWSFGADANLQEFNRHATHTAGAAGIIYLAAGSSVRAVEDRQEVTELWARHDLGEFHGISITLSPNSDLVVVNDLRELMIIATQSGGPATTGWPSLGGGPRNTYARP